METVAVCGLAVVSLASIAIMCWALVERDRMGREVEAANFERADAVNGNINTYQALEECRARCRALSLALACAIDDADGIIVGVRTAECGDDLVRCDVVEDAVYEIRLHAPGGPLGGIAIQARGTFYSPKRGGKHVDH